MIIKDQPKKENNNFERLTAGTYQAVCYAVWDIGKQIITWNGEEKIQHKIVIAWEVNQRIKNGEYAGKRFVVSKTYTLSFFDKANLRKDLNSWIGITQEQAEKGIDTDTLIGKNCLLTWLQIAWVISVP